MDNEQERLSGIIDDLAADRDPAARKDLPPQEAELAEVAAMLRAAVESRLEPRDEFVDSLAQRLAHNDDAPAAEQPAPRARVLTAISVCNALRRRWPCIAVRGRRRCRCAYEKGKSDGRQEEAASALTAPMVPQESRELAAHGFALASVPVGFGSALQDRRPGRFSGQPGQRPLVLTPLRGMHPHGLHVDMAERRRDVPLSVHGAQYDSGGLVLSGMPGILCPVAGQSGGRRRRVRVVVGEHPTTTTIARTAIG